jgi:hypothetical protein
MLPRLPVKLKGPLIIAMILKFKKVYKNIKLLPCKSEIKDYVVDKCGQKRTIADIFKEILLKNKQIAKTSSEEDENMMKR